MTSEEEQAEASLMSLRKSLHELNAEGNTQFAALIQKAELKERLMDQLTAIRREVQLKEQLQREQESRLTFDDDLTEDAKQHIVDEILNELLMKIVKKTIEVSESENPNIVEDPAILSILRNRERTSEGALDITNADWESLADYFVLKLFEYAEKATTNQLQVVVVSRNLLEGSDSLSPEETTMTVKVTPHLTVSKLHKIAQKHWGITYSKDDGNLVLVDEVGVMWPKNTLVRTIEPSSQSLKLYFRFEPGIDHAAVFSNFANESKVLRHFIPPWMEPDGSLRRADGVSKESPSANKVHHTHVPQGQYLKYDPVLNSPFRLMRDFVCFLVLFMVMMFGFTYSLFNVHSAYVMSNGLQVRLLEVSFNVSDTTLMTYDQVSMWPEFYNWVEGPLTEYLAEIGYLGSQPTIDVHPVHTVVVSPIRFRKSTVSSTRCPQPCDPVVVCYPGYDDSTIGRSSNGTASTCATDFGGDCKDFFRESSSSLGPSLALPSSDDPNIPRIRGKHAVYLSSGYVVDSTTRDELFQILDWIDSPATRLVSVEFVMYNSNLNVLTQVVAFGELNEHGSFATSLRVETFWLRVSAQSVAGVSCFFAASVLLYMVVILARYWKLARILLVYQRQMAHRDTESLSFCFWFWGVLGNFLSNAWVVVDLLIFALVLVTIVLLCMVYLSERISQYPLTSTPTSYVQLVDLAALAFGARACNGLALLVLGSKVFRYFRFNRGFRLIMTAFSKSIGATLVNSTVYVHLLMAFSFCGYTAFGETEAGFRTFQSSVNTMVLMLTPATVNYQSLLNHYPIVFPIFYAAYIAIFVIFLTKMFVAIVSVPYIQTIEHARKAEPSHSKSSTVVRMWRSAVECCKRESRVRVPLKKT